MVVHIHKDFAAKGSLERKKPPPPSHPRMLCSSGLWYSRGSNCCVGVGPEEPPSSGFDVREGLGGDGTEGTPQHLEVPGHIVIEDIIITKVAVGDVHIYTNKTGKNLIIIQLIFTNKTR